MTVKAAGVDVPPPGEGLKTVRLTEPPVSRSVAGMLALSWVALTRAVVRELPFQRTTELATKLEPVTVSVNAAPPTAALVGESERRAGTGLVTLKLSAPERPPPGAGLKTVTSVVPGNAMSAAEIVAVSRESLTKTVVRPEPPQRTTEFTTKLFPVTVRVDCAPPAVALVGLRE